MSPAPNTHLHRSSNPRIAAVNKIMMSKLMFREGNEETVLNHNFKRSRNILTQEVCAEKSCKPESAHLQGKEVTSLLNCYSCWFLFENSCLEYIIKKKYNFNMLFFWLENPSEILNRISGYDSGLLSSQEEVPLILFVLL